MMQPRSTAGAGKHAYRTMGTRNNRQHINLLSSRIKKTLKKEAHGPGGGSSFKPGVKQPATTDKTKIRAESGAMSLANHRADHLKSAFIFEEHLQ